MASLKLVGASPKILTFWKNTDQLQTIFNHFSEKVCIILLHLMEWSVLQTKIIYTDQVVISAKDD